MSYAFDTLSRAWRDKIRPLVADERLAMMFEMLMQDMHSANHRCCDHVNRDSAVTASARRLDAEMKGGAE